MEDASAARRGRRRYIRLAASLLRSIRIGRVADLQDSALAAEHVLAAFALVECLAGDNAVDFYVLSVSS